MIVGAGEDGVVVVVEVGEDGVVVFHFPYRTSYMKLPRKVQIAVQKVNNLLQPVIRKHFLLEEVAGTQ